MSRDTMVLHSHSSIERELKFPKHMVLVDAIFAQDFRNRGMTTTPFKYRGDYYVKVSIQDFVKLGGVFKN